MQKRSLILYKIALVIGLFLIGTGYVDAHSLTHVIPSNDSSGYRPDDMSPLFDSSFSMAWDIYLNTWDTEAIDPYLYDFMSFNQPVNLCLSADSLGFMMPVLTPVTSEFGWRWGRPHQGIDLDLETGDSVVSAFDGIVRVSGYHSGYGNTVIVRHYNGLETLYGHLSARNVQPGDRVKAGDLIGLGGSTGRSTGSHLHFEMRFMGRPIDPNKFISFEKLSLHCNDVIIDKDIFESYNLVKRGKGEMHDETALHKGKVGKSKYHTVKRGDTLSAIARRHKTTVSKLCKLNHIKSTTILKLGRKLKVS